MAGAVVVLAFTAVFINWYYYREIRGSLDREFGFRLRSIASLASAHIGGEYRLDYSDTGIPGLRILEEAESALLNIKSRYDLSNIMIIREDGKVMYSLESSIIPPGEDYLNWNMDYREIVKALEGEAASTELIRSQYGSYMKAGYAPLNGPGERSSYAVAAEASPAFLKSMDLWRTSLLITSLFLAGGILLSVILILKSTDSLVKARESLMRSESLAAMGRMTAVITHEIRNPLFIIRSSAEKLKEDHPEDSSEIDEFIIDEVDRLDRTLTEYLSFSRGEGNERKETDLARLLSRSIKSTEKALGADNIEIKADSMESPAPYTGDEKRILQAFMNIMVNSIQSMDGEGRISVSLKRTPDSYRISFSDNGPGIPEKQQEKVFEPFYTTRATGSGLGLSVVKECAEAHGGTVELSSRPECGTEITISLPFSFADESGEENE